MKTAKEQTPATKEVKEETGAEGQAVTMTEEQLAQLLEQAAESGATKALKAAADAADDETKDDPADDETAALLRELNHVCRTVRLLGVYTK